MEIDASVVGGALMAAGFGLGHAVAVAKTASRFAKHTRDVQDKATALVLESAERAKIVIHALLNSAHEIVKDRLNEEEFAAAIQKIARDKYGVMIVLAPNHDPETNDVNKIGSAG